MMFLFILAVVMVAAAIRFLSRGLRTYSERRTRDILFGSLLLVFALPVVFISMVRLVGYVQYMIVHTDWNLYKETDELIVEIGEQLVKLPSAGSPETVIQAYTEIIQRIKDNELTESQMKALAASCIPNDGPMARPRGELWESYRRRVLHALSRRGVLSPTQKSQFYEALVDVSLHARPTTWVVNGIPLVIDIQTHPSDVFHPGTPCKVRIERLSLSAAGQSKHLKIGLSTMSLRKGWLYTRVSNRFREVKTSAWHGEIVVLDAPDAISLEMSVPVATPAVYEIDASVLFDFFARSPDKSTNQQVLYQVRREIHATSEVLAAEPENAVTESMEYDSYPRITIDSQRITITTGASGVAFDVMARGSGRRQTNIGTIRQARNTTMAWHAVTPPKFPGGVWYTWALTPNVDLARQSVDMSRIWGQEVRLNTP